MELIDTWWSAGEVQKLLRLAEYESRLSSDVLDTLPCGVGILDNDLRLVSHNHAFSRILEENGLDSRLFSALTQDVSRSKHLSSQLLAPNRVAKIGLPVGSGEKLEVELARLAGTSGRIVATVAPPELQGFKRAKNELAAIWLQQAPNAMYVIEAYRQLIFANDSFAGLVGFSPSELLGMSIDDLISPHPGAATSRTGDRLVITRSGDLLTKDGRQILVETTETSVIHEDKSTTVCSARIRPPANEVETQRQAMDALERMSGEIAHRFNNLLTIVLSYADLVARKFGSVESLAREVGCISDAANSAAEMTSQLLTFSRGRPGKLEVFPVNRAIQGIRPQLQQLAGKNTSLHFLLADRAGDVKMSAQDFETIVVNLVSNAAEALSGPGDVTVETFDAKPDLGKLRQVHRFGDILDENMQFIAVKDTGSGIEDALLSRIFEPFCTSRSGKLGLGLPVVYGIVKKAAGTIALASAPGSGTIIWIGLPKAAV
ncbi:MAG TPA: ATP-binding protein [Bryobacteraceae bacterium]|nr:ATP-binding protein [Bryobacteraceae bacterium]